MPRERPLNATSLKDLDERITSAAEALPLSGEDPLSAAFTLNPRQKDDSVQDTVNDEQDLKFADPLFKKALDEQFRSEEAHNFEYWGKPIPVEVSDDLVFSTKSLRLTFQNIGRKLADAEKHFRETGGANDPMILTSFEAACIFRSHIMVTVRMDHAERLVHTFTHFLCTRQQLVDETARTLSIYHHKLQELLWSQCKEKTVVFGKVLKEAGIDAMDIANLQLKSTAQCHKIELLEAQLDLLSAMNSGLREHVDDIKSFAEKMRPTDCRWGNLPMSQTKPKKLDWEAYEKEVKELKRAVQSSRKKLEESEVQVKEKSQEMMVRFIDILLRKVRELGGESLANSLTQDVFGSLIGIVGANSAATYLPPSVSYSEFLPTVHSALEQSELPQQSNVDSPAMQHLRSVLSLKAYFADGDTPPEFYNNDWVYVSLSDFIASRHESHSAVAEASHARKELQDQSEIMKTFYAKAEDFRGLYYSHMLHCKKATDKGHCADKRIGEWADKIVELFGHDEELHNKWMTLPGKEKLIRLTRAIKRVVRDRDEAIRKNEPLVSKIAQREKALLEKDTLIAHARDAQDQRVEDKNQQLNEMSLKFDKEKAERQNAIANVDKVRNEWQKKLQRAFDKNVALEKQIKDKDDELKTTKLDLDATVKQLSETQIHLEKVKKLGREARDEVKKGKELKRERDDALAQVLSLRSNEEVVKDRIAKAVSAAVKKVKDEKDARIAELADLLATREQARLSDEETIRDLSRIKEDHMKCKTRL